MHVRQEVPVNHTILRWAREQADFTLEQAAARARIKHLKRGSVTAGDRLLAWESGTEKPTLGELEAIAKAYRRPLLTFFMSVPPRPETGLSDFRTLGDKSVTGGTPEFAAFRRQIEALQREVRVVVEEEEAQPLDFVGSAAPNASHGEIVQEIRAKLGLAFEDHQHVRDSHELFGLLRDRAGDAGIFVLRKADLGSHHSKISVEEFRGLVISDPIAPFVVVNPDDAPSALVFTLVHELAHLWLGESGISNLGILGEPHQPNHQDREVFCNRVAAEFLVPEAVLTREWHRFAGTEIDDAMQSLSRVFKVSRVVVARRLLDLQEIPQQRYWALYDRWKSEWDRERERYDQRKGGPGYFVSTRSKLGTKLLSTVIRAAYDGRLSYRDASKLLAVKIDHFDKLYRGQ